MASGSGCGLMDYIGEFFNGGLSSSRDARVPSLLAGEVGFCVV